MGFIFEEKYGLLWIWNILPYITISNARGFQDNHYMPALEVHQFMYPHLMTPLNFLSIVTSIHREDNVIIRAEFYRNTSLWRTASNV